MAVAASRGASGKLAAAIASGKGTPDRRWNRADLAAGIDHCFVWAMLRDHDGGIARDPLRRFRRNVAGRAVDFHDGVTDVRTARGLRRVQRRPIDMDHDLVPIARSAPIEIASERDFGQPRQRVGAPLPWRHLIDDVTTIWRFRRLSKELIGRRLECPLDDGTNLRRQTARLA